jgi:hypothetical protein
MNPNAIAKALGAGVLASWGAFQTAAARGPVTGGLWGYIAGVGLVAFAVVWLVPNVPSPVAKVLPELLGVPSPRAAAAAAFAVDLATANAPVAVPVTVPVAPVPPVTP